MFDEAKRLVPFCYDDKDLLNCSFELLHKNLNKKYKDFEVDFHLMLSGLCIMKKEGKEIVLVRPETSPDDASGMAVAEGILTSTGGPTSHAALVARGWGIPCVVGCEAIKVDLSSKTFHVGSKVFKEG